MPVRWESPIYRLKTPTGREVTIDVTASVSGGLGPNQMVTGTLIPFFLQANVRKIIDFGAGALRNTLPLLAAGFEVCAVEFEHGFTRPTPAAQLSEARTYPNFSSLVWPHDFMNTGARFDVALLCYVLQTMPIPAERELVIKTLKKKLKSEAYLVYMSRYNQGFGSISRAQRVSDGYFMWPKREQHSFYREFTTPETHEMFTRRGFEYVRSLSQRGTEQMFLYGRGPASWV
jgi:hypothetical protein